MYQLIRTGQKLIFIAILFMLSQITNAQIISVNGTSSKNRLAVTSTGQSSVRWTVVEAATNGGNVQVNSSSGVFLAPDNSVLGTVTQNLSASRNMPLPGNTVFNFVESLVIPQSILRLASSRGFSTVFYTRQFSDFPDNTRQSAAIRFALTGGSLAGLLEVKRIQLEFDDGRTTAVINKNSDLRARAIIRYNGSGLLEYSWEIAQPPVTQGKVVFIPLITRKQFLLAGREVVVETPKLPTLAKGQYLLRLKINRPAVAFTLPSLTYAINDQVASIKETPIIALMVSSPAENVFLNKATKFVWEKIENAQAYQLELYNRPFREVDMSQFRNQTPITGMLVPADRTSLEISQLTQKHLQSGKVYFWRIIAISDKGKIIAKSKFRKIKIQ